MTNHNKNIERISIETNIETKEFKAEKFINDIFELKTPLFQIKIKDEGGEDLIKLFVDGTCITEKTGEVRVSKTVINVYRSILSIALSSPQIRAILLKDGKLSNFIAPYLESKG